MKAIARRVRKLETRAVGYRALDAETTTVIIDYIDPDGLVAESYTVTSLRRNR